MSNQVFLSTQEVQTMVNIMRPEILQSPTFLNADILANLAINAITGIQFQESQIVWVRRGGTTRRYDATKKLKSNNGALVERKLEVALSWNRYADNIQNYREKEPFRINPDNTFEAPNSEAAVRAIVASYNEDVFSNLFFGNKQGKDESLALYDGFYTHIDRAINSGEISAALGNLIKTEETGDIVIGASNKADNWYAFKAFCNALSPKLRNAKEVIVYMSPECHGEIVEGYLAVYSHLQTKDVDNADYRFVTLPNVRIVSHPVMGKGTRMIASVPGNLDFGVDSLNNQAMVRVENNPEDFNELVYQIQSAQGTRIRMIEASSFAVNDADANTPMAGLAGDFTAATITLAVNEDGKGTVAATIGGSAADAEALADVEAGTAVEIKATDGTGTFKHWADGNTDNPRTVIATGLPMQFTAVFE